MRVLASFASSDAGKAFARIEDRFGRDPARFLEPVDDVLAHNLRAALIMNLADDEPHQSEDNPVEHARAAGAAIREHLHG